MDKREANMKSSNMEALAFKSGLQEMEEGGLNVAEVVTDAHGSIAKHMSMFSEIWCCFASSFNKCKGPGHMKHLVSAKC